MRAAKADKLAPIKILLGWFLPSSGSCRRLQWFSCLPLCALFNFEHERILRLEPETYNKLRFTDMLMLVVGETGVY